MKSGGRNSGPLIVKLFFRRCKVRKVCVEDGLRSRLLINKFLKLSVPIPDEERKIT